MALRETDYHGIPRNGLNTAELITADNADKRGTPRKEQKPFVVNSNNKGKAVVVNKKKAVAVSAVFRVFRVLRGNHLKIHEVR